MVGVVPHERRKIERDGKPRLPAAEQELVALVGIRGRAEARELAHGPEPTAVHRGMHAARKGELPGLAQLSRRIEAVQVPGRIERRHFEAAQRREILLGHRARSLPITPFTIAWATW